MPFSATSTYSKALQFTMLALILSSVCSIAVAHFLLNINLRVVHVEHLENELRVYLRLPLVFAIVSPESNESNAQSVPITPYSTDVVEQGELMHYLDLAAVAKNEQGLAQMIVDGHHFFVNGEEISGKMTAIKLYPAGKQPAFASLLEAKQAFAELELYPANEPKPYVGDTIVDVLVSYRLTEKIIQYSFSSHLKPGLPGQEQMSNLLFDYAEGERLVFQQTGLLETPIVVTREAWRSAITFIRLGIHHILSGLDHLLFVFCLTLGALKLSTLAWRVSAFTLGHMVTLIVGVLGFTPAVVWFVPAVEAAIALSIVYVACLALKKREDKASLLVVAMMGLLHGLGFSFVMQEVLHVNVPKLWSSLLSFNLGIEIGQLFIIIVVWFLLRCLSIFPVGLLSTIRVVLISVSIGIAGYWFFERTIDVITSIV